MLRCQRVDELSSAASSDPHVPVPDGGKRRSREARGSRTITGDIQGGELAMLAIE